MGTGGPSAIKSPTPRLLTLFYISNELFSRTVASQVSSPRQSLTSVFGMGTGGPSAVISLIAMAPRTGLEPVTLRLTAGCSTIELPRNNDGFDKFKPVFIDFFVAFPSCNEVHLPYRLS